MTDHEVPQDRQLADAQANADAAQSGFQQAVAHVHAKRADYMCIRLRDPAAQTTDRARRKWAKALRAQVDAQVAMERARDELTAIHHQTAEHALHHTEPPEEI